MECWGTRGQGAWSDMGCVGKGHGVMGDAWARGLGYVGKVRRVMGYAPAQKYAPRMTSSYCDITEPTMAALPPMIT